MKGWLNMQITDEQKKIIMAEAKTIIVMAGPGSGKTTTLLNKLKKDCVDETYASSSLVVTFSKQARINLEERINKGNNQLIKKASISTFHAFCYKLVMRFEQANGMFTNKAAPTIADSPTYNDYINKTLRGNELAKRKALMVNTFNDPENSHIYGFERCDDLHEEYIILSEINELISSASLSYMRGNDKLYDTKGYTKFTGGKLTDYIKKNNKNIIFEMKKMLSAIKSESLSHEHLLKNIESINDEFPSGKSLLTEALRYLVIKMYDDNVLDYDDLLIRANELLDIPHVFQMVSGEIKHIYIDEYQDTNKPQDSIIRELSKPSDVTTFIVGDKDQSIYEWRGAASSNLNKAASNYEDVKVLELTKNFRSTDKIIKASESVINTDKDGINKHMKSQIKLDNPNDTKVLYSRVEFIENASAVVVDTINRYVDNESSLNEIMVLYRVNSLSTHFEKQLMLNKIPYNMLKNTPVYNFSDLSTRVLLNILYASISKDQSSIPTAKEVEIDDLEQLHALPTKQTINDFCNKYEININTKSESYGEFITLINEMLNEKKLDEIIYDFIFMKQNASSGVTLSTIHGVKGLEAKHIIIYGLNEGVLPHWRAINEGNIDEERNLMYVALSRAKLTLDLISYRYNERNKSQDESRFISEMSKVIESAPKPNSKSKGESKGKPEDESNKDEPNGKSEDKNENESKPEPNVDDQPKALDNDKSDASKKQPSKTNGDAPKKKPSEAKGEDDKLVENTFKNLKLRAGRLAMTKKSGRILHETIVDHGLDSYTMRMLESKQNINIQLIHNEEVIDEITHECADVAKSYIIGRIVKRQINENT